MSRLVTSSRCSMKFGVALSMLVILALASDSSAFQFWSTGGIDHRLPDAPDQLLYNPCNIDPGSLREQALQESIVEWSRTGGVTTPYFLGTIETDECQITHGDRLNEFGYVPVSELDSGNIAQTEAFTPAGRIIEVSVLAGDQLNLRRAADFALANASTRARATILHEIGHATGLQHDNARFNMMRVGLSPLVPGHEGDTMPFPDDQRGVRRFHGNASNEFNVFVSAQVFLDALPPVFQDRYITAFGAPNTNSDRVVSYNDRSRHRIFNPILGECAAFEPGCTSVRSRDVGTARILDLCPGEEFSVPYTVGNRSNQDSDIREHHIGFYLGTQAAILSGTLGALDDNERFFDSTARPIVSDVERLTISPDPDCAVPGSYFVHVVADLCEEIVERNEDIVQGALERDNIVRTGVAVQILPPTDARCTAGPPSDGTCGDAVFGDICPFSPPQPPIGDPLPPDFFNCPDGPGGCEGGQCADRELPGNTTSKLDPRSLFHPDGDASIDSNCNDDLIGSEAVCVEEIFDGQPFGVCRECGTGPGQTMLGCECTSEDACGGGLSCWGEDTGGPGARGLCYPASGPPSWQCGVDCRRILGQNSGFCYHEGRTGAVCMDVLCMQNELEMCDDLGLICDLEAGSCAQVDDDGVPLCCTSECMNTAECEAKGYPAGAYFCDFQVGAGRCRPLP